MKNLFLTLLLTTALTVQAENTASAGGPMPTGTITEKYSHGGHFTTEGGRAVFIAPDSNNNIIWNWDFDGDDSHTFTGIGQWEISRDQILDVYESPQDNGILVFDSNGTRIHIPNHSEAPHWGVNYDHLGRPIEEATIKFIIEGKQFDLKGLDHLTTDEKIEVIDHSDKVIIFYGDKTKGD